MEAPAFVPANELETALVEAQNGQRTVPEFFGSLLRSQVYLLLDREIGADGQLDASVNPCVLSNAAGSPVLAAFTSPERANGWTERLPQFAHGLLVSFPWVLLRLGPKVGLVLNPECAVGVEIGAEALVKLKERIIASQPGARAPGATPPDPAAAGGWDVPGGRLN